MMTTQGDVKLSTVLFIFVYKKFLFSNIYSWLWLVRGFEWREGPGAHGRKPLLDAPGDD